MGAWSSLERSGDHVVLEVGDRPMPRLTDRCWASRRTCGVVPAVDIEMARAAILLALLLAGCGGSEVAAPVPERPADTLVVLSDANRLTAIDVESGRRVSRRVRSLPACGAELFVTGGRVVFSAVVKGRTTVYSLPLSLDGRPKRLGTAHAFYPSTAGRVWLAGTDCDQSASHGLREVTVDGRETFERGGPLPGDWVAGAVPEGLVILDEREEFVWDPRTGRIAETRFDAEAVPSPDRSLVAVPVAARRRWSVDLVDGDTRTPIRGSTTGRRWYPELSWSAGSRLFIRDGFRVKTYRPGDARAERLSFRLPRSTVAIAAG